MSEVNATEANATAANEASQVSAANAAIVPAPVREFAAPRLLEQLEKTHGQLSVREQVAQLANVCFSLSEELKALRAEQNG